MNAALYKLLVLVIGLTFLSYNLAQDVSRPAHWQTESHSRDAEANYGIVFPQDRVNTLTITISPENWQAMQDNMFELHGDPTIARGPGGPAGPAGPAGFPPGGPPPGFPPPPAQDGQGGFPPPPPPPPLDGFPAGAPPLNGFPPEGRPPTLGSGENPMWVPATLSFNGQIWENVGIRYKGNSTLRFSWNAQSNKMPFKLDFDEFEDDYPEIDNQRFYGFKQLSLANNIRDTSNLRHATAYDIMENMGLAAPQTAWYDIYLDIGQGLERLGIYTVVEVIDDTVIERFFGDDQGNIYEAEGNAANLSATSTNLAESFQKENNRSSDYADIEALHSALHASTRLSNPTQWRSDLEAVFDVDTFLKWLATNTVMENWDTYGSLPHNYYLYNNPDTNQLYWIGWDYNESLGGGGNGGGNSGGGNGGNGGGPNRQGAGGQARPPTVVGQVDPNNPNAQPRGGGRGAGGPRGQAGRPGGGGPNRTPASLDQANATEAWPLIRFLIDDATYKSVYQNYVALAVSTAFHADTMTSYYNTKASILMPYVDDVANFQSELNRLIQHSYTRAEAVRGYLNSVNQ